MTKGTVRKQLWAFFAKRPRVLGLYAILMLYHPFKVIAVPFYLGRLTTSLNKPHAEYDWAKIRHFALVVGGLWALSFAFQVALGCVDAEIVSQFDAYTRGNAIRHILQSYRRNYRELEMGDVIVKLSRLPYTARRIYQQMRNKLIPIVLTLLVGFGFYMRVHPMLAGLFSAFVICISLLLVVIGFVMYNMYRKNVDEEDQLHEDIDDFASNLFALYITDTVKFEQKRVEGTMDELRKLKRKARYGVVGFRSLATLIRYSFIIAMILLAIHLHIKGKLDALTPVLFMTMTLDTVLYDMIMEYEDFTWYMADMAKVETFFDRTESYAVSAPPEEREEHIARHGTIVYDRVGVRHEGRSQLFKSVSVKINHGDRVLITGHIGSGKSTLTRLLVGLHPYTGSLQIDGHEVRDMSSREIQRAVTYIPQSPRLFNRSLFENIVYGFDTSVGREEIEALLRRMSIPGFPSLDVMVGKNGSRLSGGQRTIVYLIRAFLRKTPIIILDEPTAALDATTKTVVKRVVDDLFRGQTVIVITHDSTLRWGEVNEQL